MKTTGLIRSRAAALALGLLGGVSAVALSLSPAASPAAEAKPIVVQAPAGAPMSFADLIDRVSPAVVSVQVVTEVETEESYRDLFERFRGLPGFEDFMERRGQQDDESEGGEGEEDERRRREGRSLGSGFFISETGHIVTNNHVVEDATEVTVTLSNGDELEAEIVGLDPLTDLAVLKVREPGEYPYVKFSLEKPPRVGDWVVAVGNPFGLGGTATAGIVSAEGRIIGGNSYSDFIQIDASINRGNSGGPTFDLHGQVIGVNTAIFSPSGGSVGIGFAIEAATAQQIVDILIEDGKVTRGWLGVTIQSLTDEMADAVDLKSTRGAFVQSVQSDSPASKGGIKPSDVILEVNGHVVQDSRELTQRVGGLIAGSTNTFKIYRDGDIVTVNVTVGVRPDDLTTFNEDTTLVPAEPEEQDEDGKSVYGVTVKPLTSATREALGLSANEKGLFVSRVEFDSVFDEAGIREGDAILEARGKTLTSADELESVIAEALKDDKDNILVAVRRGSNTLFVPLAVGEISNEDE